MTTYRPYYDEIKHGMTDSSVSANKSRENKLQSDRGIKDVLRSLAPRYSETLKLLATLQLADKSTEANGVEYSSFRGQCQSKMFVTSDNALRLMLGELKDHDIVSLKIGAEGNERVLIPHPPSVVQMIIDFCSKPN